MLGRLKRRLGPVAAAASDLLLQDLLEDATAYCLAYTGRKTLPRGLLDSVIVELAAGAYLHLGTEGESSHSEGGISFSYEGLPNHLRDILNGYRLGKVGGA